MNPSDQSGQASGPIIEVLYFDGCANYELAVTLIGQALAAEQVTARLRMIRVDTDAEARRYGFYGSPTIRVNGKDIAPLPEQATPGLACRIYRLPSGRLAPVPAYETLVASLRQNAGHQ